METARQSKTRKLLFISPTWPKAAGNGRAMRADAVSRALARRYDLHLALARPDGTEAPDAREGITLHGPARSFRDSLRRWIETHSAAVYRRLYAAPPDWMLPDSTTQAKFLQLTNAVNVDRVHVFRIYMAPFAGPLLNKVPCQLDLDECESRTRRRISELARRNGHTSMADSLAEEAQFYQRVEREWLPRFTRVFVASESDRAYLLERDARLNIDVLPNTIDVPPEASAKPKRNSRQTTPLTLLFVGNLSYYPNEDGVRFFVREVLPIIRGRAREVRLEVLGAGASRSLQACLSRQPNVRFSGYVPDLKAAYASADVAVVPIRAGGGTRIKVLEAFARRVPVVSTTLGAEGICARDGEHLLLADTPEQFAEACLRTADDETIKEELCHRAYALVAERYNSASLFLPD